MKLKNKNAIIHKNARQLFVKYLKTKKAEDETSSFRLSGDSMNYLLKHGDEVYIKQSPLSEIDVGDIILLAVRNGTDIAYVAHRLLWKCSKDGQYGFVTKGDMVWNLDDFGGYKEVLGKITGYKRNGAIGLSFDNNTTSLLSWAISIYSFGICTLRAVSASVRKAVGNSLLIMSSLMPAGPGSLLVRARVMIYLYADSISGCLSSVFAVIPKIMIKYFVSAWNVDKESERDGIINRAVCVIGRAVYCPSCMIIRAYFNVRLSLHILTVFGARIIKKPAV